MGTVYLINAWGTEKYKIGYTKRDINHRLRELQTGCPDEIILVKKFECKHYQKVESWLHRKHNFKRIEGEWFILEDIDVHEFLPECDKIHLTIEYLLKENHFYK